MPILGLSPLNSAEQIECEEQSFSNRAEEENGKNQKGGDEEHEEISVVKVALEQSGGFWDLAMDLLKYA